MRAYRPCAWWIEITEREERNESLTSPKSPSLTPGGKIRKKKEWRGEEQVVSVFFSFYFCLLQIVFEHIWAHLFLHRESPVQLTWNISCETKASVEGGGMLLYGQVERQKPHFLLISYTLNFHSCAPVFCVTLTSEFRLSHLDVNNHLYYSASHSSYRSLYSLTVWLWEESNPPSS